MAITATGSSVSQVYGTNPYQPTGATAPTAGRTDTSNGFSATTANATLGNAYADVAAAPLDTSTGASTSNSNAVLQYAQDKMGTQDGNGECYTLADNALKAAGDKSAPNYGRVTPNADYKWGTQVPLNQSQPGDVLQFRNYDSKVTNSDGSWSEQSRPHHTAIVQSNDGKGNITVLEQNVEGGPVQQTQLTFGNGKTTNPDGSTSTTKTTGQVWAYRPQTQGN
ncbi:MAG TPA: CHAP domain-containing protein [Candidatus Xenobia bacterium]|jgi:hypothetical protein